MAALFVVAVLPTTSFGQTKLYVVDSGSDTISVIDANSGDVTKTIKGPGHLVAIAYNPKDGLLYLPTQDENGKVYLIDPSTDSFVGKPIVVGAFPSYITISAELDRAYVSNLFGGLSVIDTTTRTVITEIAAVIAPLGSASSPGQGKVYVINHQTSEVSVIDTSSNAVLSTLPIGCFNPLDVKIDPSLHKAFATKGNCTELAVLDTLDDSLVTTVTFPGRPPRRPQYIAIDSAAHRAYVTLIWGHEEKGMFGAVAIVNTVDNSLVGGIPLGENPTRLALDVSEHRLYVTDRRTDSVFVVDTTDDTVLNQIRVGSDPADIAIVPAPAPKVH